MSNNKQSSKDEQTQIADTVAAVVGGATVTEPEQQPKNPIFALFADPHFEPIENAREYTNRDGSRVVGVANVAIPLRTSNIVTQGTIRLRRVRKGAPAVAEFTFKAGAFKPLDQAANTLLQEYRRHVAELYAKRQNGRIVVGVSAAAVQVSADWSDSDDEN